MEVGWRCLLNTSDVLKGDRNGGTTSRATGVIIGKQRHAEDPGRELYFFHTTSIEVPGSYRAAVKRDKATFTLSDQMQKHFSNEITSKVSYYASTEGYKYSLDGWYDAEHFTPLMEDEESNAALEEQQQQLQHRGRTGSKPMILSEIPPSWTEAMAQFTAPCEVRYLCYTFHPWFSSPFHALEYLTLPERHYCYSVHICHRCLTPFFSQVHLAVHLEGYCHMSRPCGELLYHNPKNQQKVFYVNGAKNLHYGRCASLLGKLFIESKLLGNDVDLYEFFVVTIPSYRLPYFHRGCSRHTTDAGTSGGTSPKTSSSSIICGKQGREDEAQRQQREEERAFQLAAAQYDAERWEGDVVVGYFSRLKHSSQTLSCIVTLPPFQQMRLGVFLLDVAYYLTGVRQRMCGCSQCGTPLEGGRISRPFSPHGQQLLLSYWSHALRRCVAKRVAQDATLHSCRNTVSDRCTAVGGGITFESVEAIRDAMDISIHVDDVEFLLVHDRCAFYALDNQQQHHPLCGTSALSSCIASERGGGHSAGASDGRPLSSAATPSLVGTLAFEVAALDEGTSRLSASPNETAEIGASWRFDETYLLKDKSGQLVYRRDWYHY